VDPAFSYQEYSYPQLDGGQIILIGTDGIWETENPENELFGKDRLREVIRRNSRSSAAAILEAITTTLADFRQTAPQRDDITLVVAKSKGVTPI
jgi:sigma-B regulation protein RsbU (phosphoserine phosphatase)